MRSSTGMVRVLQIEAIGRCNAVCPYCPRGAGVLPKESNHEISKETLDRALVLAAKGDNKGIYLHHRGEPFLHRRLPEIVRTVREAGFFAFLSTNLLSVTAQKVTDVLKSGLNEMQLHFTAGMTRTDIDTLMRRVHMIRRLNWALRDNACRVEINYALVGESKEQALEKLKASSCFDETFEIFFYKPHDWPSLGEMIDKGIDPTWCNWYKERSCAILANGDIVICCLDQWGKSRVANIWEVDDIRWEHLQKRDICRGCLQYEEMDWLRRDAIEVPDWLVRRQAIDPWRLSSQRAEESHD